MCVCVCVWSSLYENNSLPEQLMHVDALVPEMWLNICYLWEFMGIWEIENNCFLPLLPCCLSLIISFPLIKLSLPQTVSLFSSYFLSLFF